MDKFKRISRQGLKVQCKDVRQPPKRVKKQVMPNKILKLGSNATNEATVYTVRVTTGKGRGSGIKDPHGGVQVALVGQDGSAVLQRIPSVFDPEDTIRSMDEICEIVDDEAGADCVSYRESSAVQQEEAPFKLKYRFQEGQIDEVSFAAPELGKLAGLIIGPIGGRWLLEEATVASSRSQHIDRFYCRDVLGQGQQQGAAYLFPARPNTYAYGSGSHQVELNKEEVQQIKVIHMQEYTDTKARVFFLALILVASGTGVTGAMQGFIAAKVFFAGGVTGLMQFLLLGKSVDQIGRQAEQARAMRQDSQSGSVVGRLFNWVARNSLTRMLTSLALLSFVVSMPPYIQGVDTQAESSGSFILLCLGGYLMTKLAVVATAFTPSTPNPMLDQLLGPTTSNADITNRRLPDKQIGQ